MKELKGTKTEANLKTAFAGESEATNKYTYFASKAKKDEMCIRDSLQSMLHIPFQRTSAVHGVVASVHDIIDRGLRHGEIQLFFLQSLLQFFGEKFHDLFHLFFDERLKEHNFVQPIEEFGTERSFQQSIHL